MIAGVFTGQNVSLIRETSCPCAARLSCCKFWIFWVGVNTKFTTWHDDGSFEWLRWPKSRLFQSIYWVTWNELLMKSKLNYFYHPPPQKKSYHFFPGVGGCSKCHASIKLIGSIGGKGYMQMFDAKFKHNLVFSYRVMSSTSNRVKMKLILYKKTTWKTKGHLNLKLWN